MKKRYCIGLFILVLLVLALVPFSSRADVGGGVDWGTNNWGGHDWGGHDWGGNNWGGNDWGGGSDFGNVTGAFNPFFLFYAFNNPWLILIINVILIIRFLIWRKMRRNNQNRSQSYADPSFSTASDQNLQTLLDRDPHFSKQQFLLHVSDVFVALQQAWTAKDWRTIRAFESNNLYDQHARQLQQYIDKKQTNVVEDISVLETRIESYEEDEENSYLNAIIRARYCDYVIEDESGRVIKGKKGHRYIMTYRMQFMRKLDAKTENQTQTKATQCPNCGAPLAINQNGICEYCGAEVTTGANQWVLSALQPLEQRSA